MATYQDIHRVIKETIQVDADPVKRWTPQLVKFINHDNEFYGKFSGVAEFTRLVLHDTGLSNVDLSNCRLYDISGNMLDLNTIFPAISGLNENISILTGDISSMNERFDQISTQVCVIFPEQIYTQIPNKINAVCAYVDEVSSGMSVIVDGKISDLYDTTHGELCSVSSDLNEMIQQERSQRESSDKDISAAISAINGKIKGGLIYKGVVGADYPGVDTISGLIMTNTKGSEADVFTGYMYIVHNASGEKIIEGIRFGQGDYVVINTHDESHSSKKVKNLTSSDVDVIDAMNRDVYGYINELSNDVIGLKNISSDHEYRISEISGTLNDTVSRQSTISSDVDVIKEQVGELSVGLNTERNNRIANVVELREKISLISSDVEGLKIISSDHETRISDERNDRIENDNKLSAEMTSVSSDVSGLKDISAYHEGRLIVLEDNTSTISSNLSSLSADVGTIPTLIDTKITNKVSTLSTNWLYGDNKFISKVKEENGIIKAEARYIQDADIREGIISQNKITNLSTDLFNISSELSTIDRRNRGDVSLMGDFKWNSFNVENLTHFLHAGTSKSFDYVLRKGFMYRLSAEQKLSSLEGAEVREEIWEKNDYVIVKEHVILSDASFESFSYIKDFEKDVKLVNDRIDNLSSEFDAKLESTISLIEERSEELSNGLSIHMSSDTTGSLSTYSIYQGELCVGTIYVPESSKALSSLSSETISIEISDFNICANIRGNSISSRHFSDDVSNWLSVDILSGSYNLTGSISSLAYKDCLSVNEICGYYELSDRFSKVSIKDEVSKSRGFEKNDLSILKLPLSSYELSVAGGTLSDNVLYITDADYMDMYGCPICALTMPVEGGNAYEGVAATKTYVDDKINKFKDTIVKTTSEISSIILNKSIDQISIENIATALSILCMKLNELN